MKGNPLSLNYVAPTTFTAPDYVFLCWLHKDFLILFVIVGASHGENNYLVPVAHRG